MDSNKKRNICCIGAGYVGGPTMSMIALKCPNVIVTVVDIDQKRIDDWNSDDLTKLPIYEPGLDEIISKVRGKNLFFSTNIKSSISSADIIFLSVNTPSKEKGLGQGLGKASNLEYLEKSVREIANYSNGHTIVVEKSTVPVKTAETIKLILNSSDSNQTNKKKSYSVISNPEFLAEGSAIQDLEKPDRVLIGGEDMESINEIANLYNEWVPEKKILKTNLWSSELSKLAANAFLAQRVSSINSISAICEKTGADINEVAKAIGADKRIGSEFINAGPGFGGSCFKKDILSLIYLCNFYRLDEVAKYWESVITINDWQQERISNIIVEKLFGTVVGKKIAIFGFAFKANTNDTRESPAIKIVRNLLLEGANLSIYDPQVNMDKINGELSNCISDFLFARDNYSCCKANTVEETVVNSDAIIILTEWKEFEKLEWEKLFCLMRKPGWVFDTRNVLENITLNYPGINFWIIGRDLEH
tara:strand:- start:83 stop:1507 length:1425 start_codon:yes stop_codon:yes gene_type:complete